MKGQEGAYPKNLQQHPLLSPPEEDDAMESNMIGFSESINWCSTKRLTDALKIITVEPMIIGCMFVIEMYSMLGKEYIYLRLALDYNLTNTDREGSCNTSTVNTTDPKYVLQEKVSSETSKWILYLYTADFVIAIFSTILLGSWSDKVGRKQPLLISLFGLIILVLTYAVVVNLNLPVPYLLIGHFLCGLFGDLGNVFTCSFSYISDITTKEKRTARIAILETCIGFGGFVAFISGGPWISKQGYVYPFWFLLSVAVFNFIYISLRLTSPHGESWFTSLRKLFTTEPLFHMYQVLKPHPENRRRHMHVIAFAICFLLVFMAFTGVRDILVLYEIGLPFCWDAALIGISLAVSQVGYFVSLFMVKVFSGTSNEVKLVALGVMSNLLACVMLAFSTASWMIFLGLILQLFSNLPSPIIRSQASKLVAPKEVGSIFALLSFANNLGNLLSSLLFNGLFAATVDSSLPGAAFLIGAALTLLFVPLYWWTYRQTRDKLSGDNQRYEKVINEE